MYTPLVTINGCTKIWLNTLNDLTIPEYKATCVNVDSFRTGDDGGCKRQTSPTPPATTTTTVRRPW